MVNAFQQYKDKNFTIVGISLDKDKAKWQKAIADDHLTWAHVSDLKYWDSEILLFYGVTRYSGKCVIGSEWGDHRQEYHWRRLTEYLEGSD